MSFTLTGRGHVEEEIQERGIVLALGQAIRGVPGATIDFSGRFFTGEVTEMAGKIEEEDNEAARAAAQQPVEEGAPGSDTVGVEVDENDPVNTEPGPFEEDQAAKSAQASQPAPDGSDGS